MKLFAGTSHPALARDIARIAGIPLSKAETVRFDDSEVKVTIQEEVRDEECAVIQTAANPTDTRYMELFLFADALKRSEARKITAVIPYFGYSRQNMQHRPGECVSMNVIVRFLELVGYEKIITVDLHEEASANMFSVAFSNLSALPLLAGEVKKTLSGIDEKTTVIVAPDQEGIERARLFADTLFGEKKGVVGAAEKQRNLDALHVSRATELYADVNGKKVILVDDVVTSGGTLINAARLCRAKGAEGVLAAVTHLDATDRSITQLSESGIEKIYVSDTIPHPSLPPQFVTVSAAASLAAALKKSD